MLEESYTDESDIPAGYRALYVEKDGVFTIRPGGDVKTIEDVTKLQTATRNERTAHDQTKAELAKWTELGEIDTVQTELNRIPELEAKADGSVDEAKLQELADKRAEARIKPLESKIQALEASVSEKDAKIAEAVRREDHRFMDDTVRASCVKAGIEDEGSIQDAQLNARMMFEVRSEQEGENIIRSMTTKDGVGVTPGMDTEIWLSEMKPKRSNWWPPSVGGGSTGGNGGTVTNNPWSDKHWNLTEQGRMYKEDSKRAEQYAKQAGTTIGGSRPVKAS